MPVKVTLHMTAHSTPKALKNSVRVAHWSERYYCNTDSVSQAKDLVEGVNAAPGRVGLKDARINILGSSCQLTHYTLQPMTTFPGTGEYPSAPALRVDVNRWGPTNYRNDVPQQGVLVTAETPAPHTRSIRWIVRGIPDFQVVLGELAFQADYAAWFEDYRRAVLQNYGSYIDDRTTPAGTGLAIQTISSTGVVTGVGSLLAIPAGQLAKVVRTTMSNGRQAGGVYRVTSQNGTTKEITLGLWDKGATKGGTIRQWTRVYTTYRNIRTKGFIQATRKVGSPRDYRGQNRRKRV